MVALFSANKVRRAEQGMEAVDGKLLTSLAVQESKRDWMKSLFN